MFQTIMFQALYLSRTCQEIFFARSSSKAWWLPKVYGPRVVEGFVRGNFRSRKHLRRLSLRADGFGAWGLDGFRASGSPELSIKRFPTMPLPLTGTDGRSLGRAEAVWLKAQHVGFRLMGLRLQTPVPFRNVPPKSQALNPSSPKAARPRRFHFSVLPSTIMDGTKAFSLQKAH